MNKQLIINYKWTCDQGIETPAMHNDDLIQDAQERIFDQISNGMREGQLFTSIRFGQDIVPEEDADDGLTYSGYWDVTST